MKDEFAEAATRAGELLSTRVDGALLLRPTEGGTVKPSVRTG